MPTEETYAAIIKNDIVVSTIVVDPEMDGYEEFCESLDADCIEIVGERDRPSPGWSWDGETWEAPPTPEPDPAVEVEEPEPQDTLEDRMVRLEEKLDRLLAK